MTTVPYDTVTPSEPPSNLKEYVNGFRHRLYSAGEMAKEKLSSAQGKMKRLYDRKTEQRGFSPGDQVLALFPIVKSPFQAQFTGPFTVLRQVSDQNDVLSTPKRRKATQLCHVNMLNPSYARESRPLSAAAVESVPCTGG